MREWAKIYKIGETQVLYYVEYDSEHDKDEMGIVHQMIQDEDINFDMKLRNISVEAAFKIYDGLTQESAKKLIAMYKNAVGGY